MAAFLSLVVIIIVARLILKGFRAEPVLLLAGLILMGATQLFGWGSVLPTGVASTGIEALDGFKVIRTLFSTRAADLGLMIMALMGFAKYMQFIGANDAVVACAIKPLKHLHSPYILLFLSFIVANCLQLAIPSATGLGVLLMGTLFPVMVGLGISTASSAAVIVTSLCVAYAPTAVDAIRGSVAVQMDVVEYVIYHQGPAAVVTSLVIAFSHVFWQKHCDQKEGYSATIPDGKKQKKLSAPLFYALFPMLPIIMAIASSSLFSDGIHLNIVTIVLVSITITMIVELIRKRNLFTIMEDFKVFLNGMGTAFSNVVCLLVAAGVFAEGIKTSGTITELISMAQSVGLPAFAMSIVFAVITLLAALVMGSGNAPFLAFVELVPQIAQSMGSNAIAMILPMQQASHMGRAISPVSGVMIAVSQGAELKPFDLVKRASVPVLIGFIFHCVIIGCFY
ncbi:putative cryptic C4-dicarboxylate transporter DcuD [invertebrate metagenome]|uniref:Putative cryptic C4-dicarboxylate transporter DcuD n=1 Tax=invertebrate metagenome TaxID=1711999 RepID=A0A2H9T649_9ZZZZ